MTAAPKRMSALEVAAGGYETEPAIGTLDERLGIIVRRHGGRTRRPTATRAERVEYVRWLAANDPTADNPYGIPHRQPTLPFGGEA